MTALCYLKNTLHGGSEVARRPRPVGGEAARDLPRLLPVQLLPRAEDLEVQPRDGLEPVHDARVEPERERVLREAPRLVDRKREGRRRGDDERERDRELEARDAEPRQRPAEGTAAGASHRDPTSPCPSGRERNRWTSVPGSGSRRRKLAIAPSTEREPPPAREPAAGFAMNSRVRWSCSFDTGFTSTRASTTNGPAGRSEAGPRSRSRSSASSACSARNSRRTCRVPCGARGSFTVTR